MRDEYKELIPHIERLQAVADAISEAPSQSLQLGINEAYTFLTHYLIPHAQAEEQALYPVVGRLMGTPEVTATMSRDHIEIGRLTEALGSLRSQLVSGNLSKANEMVKRRVYGDNTSNKNKESSTQLAGSNYS